MNGWVRRAGQGQAVERGGRMKGTELGLEPVSQAVLERGAG